MQPLEKILRSFAAEVGQSIDCVQFTFDGEKVVPSMTPNDLDLESDDIIDARLL